MAYFEVDITPDGTNNATLVDSDEWMVPFDPGTGTINTVDIFVWNGTNAPVDVYLLGGSTDLSFVKDPDHYDDAQEEEQYRNVVTDNTFAAGPTLQITGLAPGSFFPFVVANSSGTNAREWLDQASCTMQIRGHADNIFNGQRVYVIGHHA